MTIPFKQSPIALNIGLLSPSNIFDLLPDDHECFVYSDLFDQLDTAAIEKLYSDKGQHAYHPRLIVSILIYAYSRGTFSSRKIERRCKEDLSFMFIAQMGCPNFRVLSDFRKDNTEFFHDCFKQTVKLALEQREELINPGKEIDAKKQISFADTDARIMGKKGDFDYRYNAQISVDADFQIIVGQHISLNANDKQEVMPALEALQETTGRLPTMMSLDNGYMSGDNLDALEKSPVDAYIATDKGEKQNPISLDESERKLTKADFTYHEADNTFTCPGGQTLNRVRKSKDGDQVYQGSADVCASCPYQPRCCESKKGEARTITTDDKEPLRQEMNAKMAMQASKDIYSRRKVIVEPVFGQLKNSGFRGFSVRGKEKVAGEFSLLCASHNIKKIVKAIFTGVVHPEFSHLAVIA